MAEKINWYGAYNLTRREIYRFIKVYNQSVISPAISALIFLVVFVLALADADKEIAGIKFVNFMGYGLIIMSIVQNSFANSASSFIMAKMMGYIIDVLIPPIGAVEVIFAFCVGAILRGLLVGFAVAIVLIPFVDFTFYHPYLLIFFVISSCALLGQLGIIVGMMSKSFDHFGAVTSYIVTPLSFLSGTFYSVESLPIFFKMINYFNPFFYMIDGFRYSLTNHADSNILFGMLLLIVSNIIIFFLLLNLLNSGWRIKN